MRDA